MTKNIKIFSGDLELRVDRRTELLGIIQRISKYNEKYPHLLEKYGNKEYVEEIEKRFNKYKTHPLINLFNDIVFNLNFSYDAPVQLFLELNDDFTFDSLMDYPFKTRLKSDKRVIEFLKLLKK